MRGVYRTVVCAEVLEHVKYPDAALLFCFDVLRPGGKLIITVPFAFPIHNFPDDYWRYTPSGLRLLLTEAGFVDIETDLLNVQKIELRDHDERLFQRDLPMHIGAIARKPE
jgi:predicted SAM-dependent methyltransferase